MRNGFTMEQLVTRNVDHVILPVSFSCTRVLYLPFSFSI